VIASEDERLELGPRIAVGRTSEVFAFGDGRVLKLLHPEFEQLGEHEAAVATLLARVYPGAPACLGTVTDGGRFGLIYERVDGPSMNERLDRRPWQLDRMARDLADLHAEMHEADGSGLPEQLPRLRAAIERACPALPPVAFDAALARVAQLRPGTAVCHGDLHPGNVLLGSDKAVVIDWENARCGNPAGDVARSLFLLRDGAPDHPPNSVVRLILGVARRRFAAVYLARYRALRPLDDAELRAWRLPILAARVAEGIEEERPFLLSRIAHEVQAAAGG
jgi:aminoglycoside phosphotransferase (APT) family kinase protein